MKKHPIGVFDSGLGGISVLNELRKELPEESFIYFADTAFCPYGDRKVKSIQKRCRKITAWMLRKNCKLIVVACNTATAAGIDMLRQNYALPFIGMEPAVKPAASQSKTKCIGILATKGTFQGKLFKKTSLKYTKGIKVIIQTGDGLVELVENGEANSQKAHLLLKKYLSKMMAANADQIVLGCTHYPFLMSQIKRVVRNRANIINPAPAVARQTKKILLQSGLPEATKSVSIKFASSGKMPLIPFYFESRNSIKVSYEDWIAL